MNRLGLKKINDAFSDLELRFDQLFLLATSLIDYSLPAGLDNLFGYDDIEEFSKALGLPKEAQEASWNGDTIREWMVEEEKFGFFAQAAMPLRHYISKTSFSSSWGHYRTTWIYAESINELIGKAKKWAESQEKKDLLRFTKSAGAKGGAA